jgi:hypothetical protein
LSTLRLAAETGRRHLKGGKIDAAAPGNDATRNGAKVGPKDTPVYLIVQLGSVTEELTGPGTSASSGMPSPRSTRGIKHSVISWMAATREA